MTSPAATMSDRPLTGRRVLAYLVAAFLVVIAVNVAFVVLALGTWSGLSVEQPYERGIKYNQTIEIDHAALALGWSADAVYDGRVISLDLRDKAGAPIDGAAVLARIERPAVEGHDIEVPLAAIGAGRYAAPASVPMAGQWYLVVTVDRGADHWRSRSRVWVSPQALD